MPKYIAKGDIAWPDDKGTGNKIRWTVGAEIDDEKIGAKLALYAKELVEVVEGEVSKEVLEKVKKKKKK